jgi:hypothetical protein
MVFTLPEGMRPVSLRNQTAIYNMLFKAVAETLKTVCEDPKHMGAMIGFVAVLHTWSQILIDHPHIHCIVPGGGLSLDGKKWICSKPDFFVPVKVLSRIFRGKFLDYLKQAYAKDQLKFDGDISPLKEEDNFNKLLNVFYRQSWHVYCKPPFKNPEKVIEYLGRYTHRVAISNDRITGFKDGRVTLKYRDYADSDKIKVMTLKATEFIRRFLLHILPDQFFKIRYYGILSARNRKTKLAKCKKLLGVTAAETDEQRLNWQELLKKITGFDPTLCPFCRKGKLFLFDVLGPVRERSPP